MSALLLLCFLFAQSACEAQDLSLYGKVNSYLFPIDTKETGQIYSKCFSGIGFVSCLPIINDNDQNTIDQELQYYRDLPSIFGAAYCLQCCGAAYDHVDTWDLSCLVDSITASTSNVYGYEFRMATNAYAGDRGYVVCPIKRSACSYDGTTTLNCDGLPTDGTFLAGFTMTINVEMYDSNFMYWRGVSSCSVEAMEQNASLVKGDYFKEVYILNHYPSFRATYQNDVTKLFGFLSFSIFVVYGVLWYFRSKLCVYCHKKLIFSPNLCYICTFVGAEPPDPFLLQALEEKALFIQGEEIEKFPGSRQLWAKIQTFVKKNPIVKRFRKDIVIEPYAVMMEKHEQMAKDALAEGCLVLNADGTLWGTNEPAPKKKKKGQKIFKMPHINSNVLKYHPDAIYAAINHHDPKYRIAQKENVKSQFYDIHGEVLQDKVDEVEQFVVEVTEIEKSVDRKEKKKKKTVAEENAELESELKKMRGGI